MFVSPNTRLTLSIGMPFDKAKVAQEWRSRSRAAGVDFGNDSYSGDGRWINVPTMASILKRMPHLKFIMTDCCNMMCLENLYELRSVCDYMIGSPAEIPDQGAPYDQIVTDMFAEGKFYSNIITKYYNATRGYLPLTAVKTSEMDNVARATRTALRTFAPADAYQQWNQALDRAIVDLRESAKWATDKPWSMKYADFSASEEKMHGVSMFVPQDPSRGNYARFNEDIKKMEWYAATN